MAHTKDYTLLTKLGFQDKDKQNPRHDAACRYIGQQIVIPKVMSNIDFDPRLKSRLDESKNICIGDTHGSIWRKGAYHNELDNGRCLDILKNGHEIKHENEVVTIRKTHDIEFVEKYTAIFEHPICKGAGQYSTHVGFIDTLLRKTIYRQTTYLETKLSFGGEWTEWVAVSDVYEEAYISMGVEVKICKIPVGDICRQIKLYQEYCYTRSGEKLSFVLVTDFDMSNNELSMLKNEKINVFRLGEGFEKFLSQQEENTPTQLPTL